MSQKGQGHHVSSVSTSRRADIALLSLIGVLALLLAIAQFSAFKYETKQGPERDVEVSQTRSFIASIQRLGKELDAAEIRVLDAHMELAESRDAERALRIRLIRTDTILENAEKEAFRNGDPNPRLSERSQAAINPI